MATQSMLFFRQDLRREHSILPSVTHMPDIHQVCHGVSCCVKNGSWFSSSLGWKSVDIIAGISYYLTNVRCHQTHCRWQFCLSARECTSALCAKHKLLHRNILTFLSPKLWLPTAHSWIPLNGKGVMQQHEYELWVNKTEGIKQRLVKYGKAVI